jgi:uncharacterized protein YeaC (DUF1315 family)
MPLHIEELTSEVTVMDGDSMLTEKQKEAIVQMVLKRLGEKGREAEHRSRCTELRRQASAPLEA